MTEPLKLEPIYDTDEGPGAAGSGSTERLDRWLELLIQMGGSDLLLLHGVPPCVRMNGEVKRIGERSLLSSEIEQSVMPALTPGALRTYRESRIGDCSYRLLNRGRFRINIHSERDRAAVAIRALPQKVPLFRDLHLPRAAESLLRVSRGLVLIGGPAGAGKTTTMAALIHEINQKDAKHIITIEDPIEYEHQNLQSVIEQVEIGIDVENFPTALRSSLRQAPDVLVIGEMRDPETVRIALGAAETGHLVLSTLHTTDVTATIARLADAFPAERQNWIRQELAATLAAVFTQVLVPSNKGGRVPAVELLMVGYGARQHIRRNMLQHLHQEITITKRSGSLTFEESLAQLVADGHINRDDAMTYAIHPEDLDSLLRNPRA